MPRQNRHYCKPRVRLEDLLVSREVVRGGVRKGVAFDSKNKFPRPYYEFMASFCAHYNRAHCLSCRWIDLDYSRQLERKENLIREALEFFPLPRFEASVSSSPQGFRNRAKMTVTGTVDLPVVGLIGGEDLDQGRELLDCPIHHPKLNEVMAAMPELIRRHRLVPYRIRERLGELKGLIGFYSPESGEMYLRFILRSKEAIERIQRDLVPELQARFPFLVCISANLQPIPHAILEGPEEIILSERRLILHRLGDLDLQLSPQAFVQTNVEVATQLYQAASRWIVEARPLRMLELYCGQGAFSFFAASNVGRILGIEINAEAVKTANETAWRLGLPHLEFKASDATRVAQEINKFQPDLVLANPPRRGLGDGVSLILQEMPQHFLYSSCSFETLALDLRQLQAVYDLKRVQLFDLFPHTEHFETLAWLRIKS